MSGMKISELDFVKLLPVFMRDDEAVKALSEAVNKLVGEPGKRLHTLRTWDKIDELTEEECDELAWELDIDWYESTIGLKEKRETIKAAQLIKRKRGTKWAVERLVAAYFGDGYVTEWFETGGAPFTFTVMTTNENIMAESFNKFLEAANAAKNERSHIANIFYLWKQDVGIEYTLKSHHHSYEYEKCGTKNRPAVFGLVIKKSIETEVGEDAYCYDFVKSGEVICGTYPQLLIIGTTIKSAITSSEKMVHALYDYEKCGTKHRASILGITVGSGIKIETTEETYTYDFVKTGEMTCGTYPQPLMSGMTIKSTIISSEDCTHALYNFEECGISGYKAIIGAAIVGSAIVGKTVVVN